MTQRARLLVLLGVSLVLAGALGGYAYFGVFKVQKAEDAKKAAELKLLSFGRDDIVKFSVTAKGDTTVLQRLDATSFKMIAPMESAADAGVAAALLNKVGSDSVKKLAAEKPADLAAFGFDKPLVSVTVTNKDGKEETVLIGAENKFDNTVFVKTSRSPSVYVADETMRFPLDKSTFDLREKRLLPLEDKDVAGISFQSADNRYALTRAGDDWSLTEPEKSPADATECGRVASSVRSLRAQAIPSDKVDDPSKYGFDHPRAKMVVTQGNGTKIDLVVGEVPGAGKDDKPKFYARAGQGFVAEIPDTFIKDIGKTTADLVDKRLFPGLDKGQVMQVKFTGQENYVVERRKGKDGADETWQVLSPRSGPGKKWKMDSILQGLTAIKGKAIADEKPKDLKKYGLDAPVRTVAMFGEGGKELGKLMVGALLESGKDTYYVKSSNSSRVYEVEKHNLDGLSQTVEEIEESPQVSNQAVSPAPMPPVPPKAAP